MVSTAVLPPGELPGNPVYKCMAGRDLCPFFLFSFFFPPSSSVCVQQAYLPRCCKNAELVVEWVSRSVAAVWVVLQLNFDLRRGCFTTL